MEQFTVAQLKSIATHYQIHLSRRLKKKGDIVFHLKTRLGAFTIDQLRQVALSKSRNINLFEKLPADVLKSLIASLDLESINKVAKINKSFAAFCQNDAVWHLKYRNEFEHTPILKGIKYKDVYLQTRSKTIYSLYIEEQKNVYLYHAGKKNVHLVSINTDDKMRANDAIASNYSKLPDSIFKELTVWLDDYEFITGGFIELKPGSKIENELHQLKKYYDVRSHFEENKLYFYSKQNKIVTLARKPSAREYFTENGIIASFGTDNTEQIYETIAILANLKQDLKISKLFGGCGNNLDTNDVKRFLATSNYMLFENNIYNIE